MSHNFQILVTLRHHSEQCVSCAGQSVDWTGRNSDPHTLRLHLQLLPAAPGKKEVHTLPSELFNVPLPLSPPSTNTHTHTHTHLTSSSSVHSTTVTVKLLTYTNPIHRLFPSFLGRSVREKVSVYIPNRKFNTYYFVSVFYTRDLGLTNFLLQGVSCFFV